jgi:mono/diheme cytochrome c family protein/glucose/arabinose dehydrogenase/lysophospholipase L1-like esterase
VLGIAAQPASGQLPLQKGDVVGIVGNGLADRMQHDGWMETLLQSRLTGQDVAFRTLAVAGDTVSQRPRSAKVPSPDDYLGQIKADVVFAFFGYNESFGGQAKVAAFKSELEQMVDKYRAANFNGKGAPRVVLFSPIAHEDLHNPLLPDGKQSNANLEVYTRVIQEVAAAKGVAFVDLFHPSQQLYVAAGKPLTLNGVHLLPEGNRQLAEVIATALTGAKVDASPAHEPLRQAVLDKSWHWHARFRAMDENDIWGSRSGLKFVNGQTNRDVLEHELTMLDVMTANRDRVVWATAQGKPHQVDDSNVPKPLEVVSNLPSPDKNPKVGTSDYLSAEESLAKLHVPDGFAVNVFADESRFPALANPVQMQVDTKGRLWAACWSTYPKWEPLKAMTDSLVIFPDDNRDGVADRAIEFAKVHNPLGFAFWNGGVIVASQPDVLFLKDTDGDDKADVRIVLFQATGSADTHHSANSFTIGPDGGLYWQSGVFLQHNYENPWGRALSSNAPGVYRFDPRSYAFSYLGSHGSNPHGVSFDRWGYLFITDGASSRASQLRLDGNKFKIFPLLNQQSRPAAANAILSSANFPDDMQQDFLICNVIGYLGLYRYDLHRDGFQNDKQTFKQGEVWGTPTDNFIFSDDRNFRPSDAEVGADGALYIADWHNAIIGHMQHNIRDPQRDKAHGRIFRIVCKDRPLQQPVAIDGQPIPALLENLRHPVDGVRERTRSELSERDSKEVAAAVSEWIKQFDPNKAEDAHPLLEGLWLLQQHGVRDQALLGALLASPEPHARTAAATVKHFWGPADPTRNKQSVVVAEVEKKVTYKAPAHLLGEDAKAYQLGGEVYHREAHCATCHQDNGKGLDPAFPPLVGSPWATGSEERLIKVVLHGLHGPLEVNGKVYDPAKGVPPMTAFGAILKDDELAAVLTYVRNTWGNKAPAVKPATVAKVRAATTERSTFWKPEELLKDHPLEPAAAVPGAGATSIVYEGGAGPGKGKRIVFLASDHEYRAEETCPALARILAKRFGFTCTVVFGVDADGFIQAGSSRIDGLEALDTADLFVVFARFLNPPEEQMAHIDAYLKRGGPVVGLRTASHAFRIPAAAKYGKYDSTSKLADYQGGFGQQVLGNTWVGHHGANHKQATRIIPVPEQRNHVILTGVGEAFCQAGAYVGKPGPGFMVLTMSQPLESMEPTAAPDPAKRPMPSTWTREYPAADGSLHRVFHTTQGASEDILDANYRRLVINGILWALGMETQIKPDIDLSFVGPYQPGTFATAGHARGVKPTDLAGWETPIMPASPRKDE